MTGGFLIDLYINFNNFFQISTHLHKRVKKLISIKIHDVFFYSIYNNDNKQKQK